MRSWLDRLRERGSPGVHLGTFAENHGDPFFRQERGNRCDIRLRETGSCCRGGRIDPLEPLAVGLEPLGDPVDERWVVPLPLVEEGRQGIHQDLHRGGVVDAHRQPGQVDFPPGQGLPEGIHVLAAHHQGERQPGHQ